MASYVMLRLMALVRTDVSEELSASIIRVTRIGEVETTLAVTSKRRKLRRNKKSPLQRRFLQEPHGVTSQKTPFFMTLLGRLERAYLSDWTQQNRRLSPIT
jgi:hypothetical protein